MVTSCSGISQRGLLRVQMEVLADTVAAALRCPSTISRDATSRRAHREVRGLVVSAVNSSVQPAPWFLRNVIGCEDNRATFALPPLTGRAGRRGRWASR
jgi:hypothetical protein